VRSASASPSEDKWKIKIERLRGEVERYRRERSEESELRHKAEVIAEQRRKELDDQARTLRALEGSLERACNALLGVTERCRLTARAMDLVLSSPRRTASPRSVSGESRSRSDRLMTLTALLEERVAEAMDAANAAVPPPDGGPVVRELAEQVERLEQRVEYYGGVEEELEKLREANRRAASASQVRAEPPEVIRAPATSEYLVVGPHWRVRSVGVQTKFYEELTRAPGPQALSPSSETLNGAVSPPTGRPPFAPSSVSREPSPRRSSKTTPYPGVGGGVLLRSAGSSPQRRPSTGQPSSRPSPHQSPMRRSSTTGTKRTSSEQRAVTPPRVVRSGLPGSRFMWAS